MRAHRVHLLRCGAQLYQDLSHTSHILLILSKQHDVINLMHQCNVSRDAQMVQIFLDCVTTEGRIVNLAHGKPINEYYCPFRMNVNSS